eukprot:TRINITY_DN15915_c0_g1_i1.p1 TRINITY_DN15915_c0_g1~~TRINITY_DN15915_c0_g1_i1.p1  ORF type:complete len:993 (+),score=346.67 TRINITY_DN15915_c0_g1_i1:23-2980(+)
MFNDTANIGDISVFEDIVMYQKEDPATSTSSLYYYDLDKDNDYLFDKVDGFPLYHKFSNDSDNDGIGDEGDIITNNHPCSTHQRFSPSSCVSDLVILYSVWGVFTFILIGSCLAVGIYRKRHRENLYYEKKSYYDEWLNRQWRETTRENFTEEELFATMAELDDKIQKANGLRGEVVVQTFLFLLTLVSVGLWVASMWERRGLSVSAENIMAWIDFFTTTVFFVDLAYRWIFRDAGEYTDFYDYVVKNWYDFPSLISDIPGVTTAGTLGILVVARLIRVLRILKMFRIVRLYHRVTQQQAVLALILRYDTIWQAIFICGLIITVGIIIKLVEQDEQDVFAHYQNVLWFCIVTVTTIGYGDMVPANPISRILAVFLMVSGIGIIGVLTASMGESVRFSGVDKEMMVARMRKMQQGKWRLSLEYLRNSVLFNPILAMFKPYQRGICSHAMCSKPSRILNNIDDVTKISFQDYKFHTSCFRCAGCGKSGSGVEGPCWVVPNTLYAAAPKRRKNVIEEEEDMSQCKAAIYLHTQCLRKARGDVIQENEEESSHESSADSGVRNLYIRKEEIIVEELIVTGMLKGGAKLNGMYQRRPAVREGSTPFYDHKKEPAIITKEDDIWKMYFVVNAGDDQVSDECFATSNLLLGTWEAEDPHYGKPMVEDACAQLHYWHKLYDPLDVPVRTLIGNYASQRTKNQFSALLEAMNNTTTYAGGKFSGGGVSYENIEHTTRMERVRCQIKVVTEMEERRAYLRAQCDPADKLALILRTYKLNEPGKVKNYVLMKDHLEYLIFCKSAGHVHGTSLAKMFSIAAAMEEKEKTDGKSEITNWGEWDEEEYDWHDTVEWTLNEMDRCLTEHDVDKLTIYNTVRIELEHLILSYDRVLTCQWAWDNLSWRRWEERAERPKRQMHNTTEMPVITNDRQQYCVNYTEAFLDPMADDLERHQLEAGKKAATQLLNISSVDEINKRFSRSLRSAQRTSSHNSLQSPL